MPSTYLNKLPVIALDEQRAINTCSFSSGQLRCMMIKLWYSVRFIIPVPSLTYISGENVSLFTKDTKSVLLSLS